MKLFAVLMALVAFAGVAKADTYLQGDQAQAKIEEMVRSGAKVTNGGWMAPMSRTYVLKNVECHEDLITKPETTKPYTFYCTITSNK